MACNDQNIKEIIHICIRSIRTAPSEYLRSAYCRKPFEELKAIQSYYVLRLYLGQRFISTFCKLQSTSIMPMALTKTQFQPIYINDLIEIILKCVNMIKKKKLIPMNGWPEIFTMRLLNFRDLFRKKAMVIPLPNL